MVEPQYRVGVDVEPRDEGAEPRSRGLAFVLSLLAVGMGHAYLGLWRRAAFWVCAPIFLPLVFCACTILIPLPAAFGTLVPVMLLGFGLAWCGAAIDVWLVPRSRHRWVSFWKLPLFWLGCVLFSVAAATASRTFLMQAFKIPSGAMQPTLMIQDHVFVNMRAFRAPPRRGQLAVFTSPEHPDEDFIKRVIALPGDRLTVQDGHPSINGWPVPHCHVGVASLPDSAPDAPTHAASAIELEFLGDQAFLIATDVPEAGGERGVQGPWTVAPDEVFVLGDSRSNSYDSRAWFEGRGGGVPFAKLIGEPVYVWLAFNADGSVNWSRYGLSLDEPALGNWAPELAAGLRECLAKRPPRAKTEPPAPH
jgi:signal peptidase I